MLYIETADVLTFQFIGSEILEKQIQFRKGVTDCSATEKSSSEVFACPLLNGADCIQQVE